MANFSELKQAIAAVVRTNNNQEITGANMQNVLTTIVNSIANGFLFKGLATPSTSPGNPDSTMFWIGGAGVYTNFGSPSFEVPVGKIAIFKYDGTFSRTVIDLFSVASSIQDNNDSLITSRQAKAALDNKANIADISQYLSEGAELPLATYYTYYGNPTQTLAGRYTYTDTYFIAVSLSYWNAAPTIAVYVKNNQNQYIYYETYRTDQALTAFEKYIADLFASSPVTYDRNGLMLAADKQTFDEMVTEVFPLTVGVISSNAGIYEIGDAQHAVTPQIVLSITRKGVDVPAVDITENITPSPAYVSPDKRTISGNQVSSGTTTYQIAVTQGGQTKNVPNQVFDFMNYRYYGVINSSTEPTKAQIKTLCENGTLTKQLSRSTKMGATDLAANKCFVFVVPTTSVNLIVKNAKSGYPISGCTVDTVTVNRVNGTATVSCKYVIVPAGAAAWTFEITN